MLVQDLKEAANQSDKHLRRLSMFITLQIDRVKSILFIFTSLLFSLTVHTRLQTNSQWADARELKLDLFKDNVIQQFERGRQRKIT